MDAHFDGKRFPVEAVTYLEKHETPRVVLAPDYWGGYVIYRLYPHRFAAGDDRHDLYGEQFLKSYLKMIHVEPGWDDFLREHRIHCVMVPLGSALSNILTETSDWKAIYMDGVAIVFVRSGEVSTLRLQNYSH